MSNQIVISSGAKLRNLNGVITGTTGVLDSVPLGGANGVATLDSSGKVPVSQLPSSVVTYLGTWNAATNTPTLANGTGDAGDMYLCNVAGTVNFGAGPITFAVGDWVLYGSGTWQKSNGQNGTVTSVAVTESGDALTITGSPITTAGTINIGFAGTSAQYVAGDGSLITFPSVITEAQNLITEVYNETGATLTKGTVVYINGGHGNLPTVTKAIATGDSTSAQTYGVIQTDIGNNNNGYVVVIGRLTNLDTQAYSAGAQLYLSSTTAGAWTTTKQYAPAHLVYVGIVTRSHPTQGVVEVKIQNGYELDELHNVSAQTPSNNDGIFYNSSNSLWEAKSIATALGYTPANDSLVVHLAGTETITGAKTFSNLVTISTASYLTSRLKLTNTATGGNIWSVSSGNANNSTNNGLFSIINETLGKNIFSLSPTGNIIIGEDVGTANPAYNLQVIGTNTVIKATDLTGNNSNVTLQVTNSAAYLIAGYTTTAIPLIFQTGNTTRLTLASTGEATFSSTVTSNDTYGLTLGSVANKRRIQYGSDVATSFTFLTDANGYAGIYAGAATFSSSVGIGVTANSDRLNVLGTDYNNTAYFLGGSTTGASYGLQIKAGTNSSDYSLLVQNQSGSSTYLKVAGSGNVGIGTSTPGQKLSIAGRLNFDTYSTDVDDFGMWATSSGTTLASYSTSNIMFRTANTERMRITSGGNVGIGTSSPTGKLDVVGDVRASGTSATIYFMNRPSSNYFAWYGSTNVLLNNSDIGNIASIAYNTGIYTPLSDINKKKDFEDSTIGLNAILNLKPTLYRMKGEENTDKHLGFIAQEVKEFIPHAYVEQNEFIGLNFNAITAALVKAIQELKAEIDELKNK